MPLKLLSIVGARPQFIKAAVFSRQVMALCDAGTDITETLLHTGQHYDFNMSESFFEELRIPTPEINLGINGGGHGKMTGQMLAAIEGELLARKPDVVVVYGDTNSTMAGALAASKLNLPIAHIEAGMRHYRRDIPEEINRVVTDHLCEYLFCSSHVSRRNLEKEGITDGVHVTGDLMYDLFRLMHPQRVAYHSETPYVVSTLHRAANTDDASQLKSIIAGLAACPYEIVLPLHPRTRNALKNFGMQMPENVRVLEPVGYCEMLGLLDTCRFVITDSGGLQKDAYFSGKRVITMSEVSPWEELTGLDVNRLVGAETNAIKNAYAWADMPVDVKEYPYGDGHSAEAMLDIMLN